MQSFKKILITGAKGMLGSAFDAACKVRYPEAAIRALGKEQLDVSKSFEVVEEFRTFRPDLVIHCAALVNVERCESDLSDAESAILIGSKNVASACQQFSSKMIYPQSFLVYDGSILPITETTQAAPSSIYGNMKFKAEQSVQSMVDDHLVIIMAGFFGGYERDKNFVGKIIPVILQKIANGDSKIEIGDRIWQPTFTADLATNSLLIAERGKCTRYCLASNGEASFAELTEQIILDLKLSDYISVKRVSSNQVVQNEIKRPDRAILSTALAESQDLLRMRSWRIALTEYLSHPYFENHVKKIIKESRH